MAARRVFVWAGGAVFVLSLAYCTWWYLLPAGREAAFGGARPLARDAALVGLFACHHSVFARESVKRRLRPLGPLARSVFVWTASILLIVVCGGWRPIGGELYRVSGAARAVLATVQLAGLILIAKSVAAIDPLELAGIHEAAAAPEALQTGGPYRLVRHPLYLGWIVAAFATPHLTGDRLAFAVLTSLYLVVAVPWEERSLSAAFGPAYARYMDEVRWRVIPFIY